MDWKDIFSRIPRIAPGILVGLLNLISPQAAYTALFAKIPFDDRVKNFSMIQFH